MKSKLHTDLFVLTYEGLILGSPKAYFTLEGAKRGLKRVTPDIRGEVNIHKFTSAGIEIHGTDFDKPKKI